MAHHKRRRPKHQRNGCLYCKPHKDERLSKRLSENQMRLIQVDPDEVLEVEYGIVEDMGMTGFDVGD